MLDLRLIRRDPDAVRAALARRSPELAERVDELTELDASWREATAAAERLRAEQKAASEGIAAAKQAGEDASDAIARMKDVSAQVKALGETARRADEELQAVLVSLPNLPDPTAADEDEVMREVGEAGCQPTRPPTISSWPASASTWSAARACRALASPTCAATWSCSSWRSCAGRCRS